MEKVFSIRNQLESLKEILATSRNIVFFGGAGVSTESGIPDFRSEKGIFKAKTEFGHAPEYLVSHACLERDPELFFSYYTQSLVAKDAKPNAAHYALAALEQRGVLKAVVTQNIDGLHQKAGSKIVHELHGSAERNYCMKCKERYDITSITESKPCKTCGGMVRPDVVLYGEQLDEQVVDASLRAIVQAETLIIGGTSLVVYPAAGFVDYFSGKHLVIINMSKTDRDSRATLVINAPIGEVFSRTVLNAS